MLLGEYGHDGCEQFALPKTVSRQRRDCDLNPDPSAPESSTLTTRLPSHPPMHIFISAVEKSRTARSDKNTNSCPKTFNKTVTGYIFYHTSKILQANKKTKKINIFNAIPKTFKGVKFIIDGSAFQTFITLSPAPCARLSWLLGSFLSARKYYIGLSCHIWYRERIASLHCSTRQCRPTTTG